MEDLIKALETISSYCKKNDLDCSKCPMGTATEDCVITTLVPSDWVIKKETITRISLDYFKN